MFAAFCLESGCFDLVICIGSYLVRESNTILITLVTEVSQNKINSACCTRKHKAPINLLLKAPLASENVYLCIQLRSVNLQLLTVVNHREFRELKNILPGLNPLLFLYLQIFLGKDITSLKKLQLFVISALHGSSTGETWPQKTIYLLQIYFNFLWKLSKTI